MNMKPMMASAACVLGAAAMAIGADGLLWSNSGWMGVTAVDMAADTVYSLFSRPPTAMGVAAVPGAAFFSFADGMLVRISSDTRRITDSIQAAADSGELGMTAADSGTVWVVETKQGRPTKLVTLNASPLQVVRADTIQDDSRRVSALAAAAGEAWFCLTNPPWLVRAARTSALAPVDLSPYVQGRTRLAINGRTGWVISDSSVLVKVNLDARSVVTTYDIRPTAGSNLSLAVSPAGMFVSRTGVTPVVVHKLGDDPTTIAGTWQYDSSSTMFLRAAGSRLVAVVAKGWYNQYEEIDPATMTLKHEVGGTYCYDMAIEEPTPSHARMPGGAAFARPRPTAAAVAQCRVDGRRVRASKRVNVPGLLVSTDAAGRVSMTAATE